MIYVFDLDDTLYPEITFVQSGFKAVAKGISTLISIDEKTIYNQLIEELNQNGRGKVFNKVLTKHDILSKKEIKRCLHTYRLHTPEISLYPYSDQVLGALSDHPLYLVTDGNKLVQNNKVKALGIENQFKKVFITHRYGVKHAKPSTYCFHKILELEKAQANELVYFGDNPKKDFINLKKEGFRTIRVKTGSYKDDFYGQSHEAEVSIPNLSHFREGLSELRNI